MNPEEIAKALTNLVGLRWRAVGRASHMLWLHFGEMREVPAVLGGTKKVGQWAIHVQCRWRLTAEGQVVLSSDDYLVDSMGHPVADQRDHQAQSRFDDAAARLCSETETRAPTVIAARLEGSDGLSLEFDDGSRFEVFPTSDGESWRLFQPAVDRPHFVTRR